MNRKRSLRIATNPSGTRSAELSIIDLAQLTSDVVLPTGLETNGAAWMSSPGSAALWTGMARRDRPYAKQQGSVPSVRHHRGVG